MNIGALGAVVGGYDDYQRKQQQQQQQQLYQRFLMQQQQQSAARQAQQIQLQQQEQQGLGAAWNAAGQLGGGGMGGQPQPQQPQPQAPSATSAMAGRLPQAAPGVNLQGENPDFRTRLASLGGAMPSDVYGASQITSGYRSPEEQAKLYASYKGGQGGLAAPPGQSMHNQGLAADWKFSNPQADQWTHQNAGRFGLGFPLGAKDPNHMQIIGEAKQVSQAVTQAVPQQQWGRSSVSDLAKAVEQANPDASPQVKMLALMQLQKLMAPQEKMELQMMLQQNRGIIQEEIAKLRTDTQRDIAGARESGLDSRLRTLEAGRDQRLQETEAGRDQRFEKGEAGRNARAQARNDIQTIKAQRQTAGTNPATRRLALQNLLTDIDQKIRSTDDEGAKAEYQAERADIVKEMQGLAGLKKTNPTPRKDVGEGGAAAALPPQ